MSCTNCKWHGSETVCRACRADTKSAPVPASVAAPPTPGNKQHAQRTECGQGHVHASKMEARRCDYWHTLLASGEILHVDVQPAVCLPCGRYRPDFLVWESGRCFFEEVKGQVKPDFRRVRKTFDACHPAAPLRVVRWYKGNWINVER